jgi:membrane-anchored protein YejM (alkaline phosphatase superfamily)
MTTASVAEIKKELRILREERLQELCLQLAKYKKENKELLSYLLFDAHDEPNYVTSIKNELDDLFASVNSFNTYYQKKNLRKILRIVNKHIKYSGILQTEIEARVYFCKKVKEAKIPMKPGTVLANLYTQQVKKIEQVFAKLPEDVRADYEREINFIRL